MIQRLIIIVGYKLSTSYKSLLPREFNITIVTILRQVPCVDIDKDSSE